MTPVLFGLLAITIQDASTPLDCSDPQSQSSMNQCAALDFQRADKALNVAWRDMVAYVRANNKDYGPDWDKRPSGEARLREAQRAWITFRDAHCAVHGYEARGGSMEPLLYESCRAEVTQQRTEQLRLLISNR
jgi:uncharacterized protein YecT (DUF1311 family)